MAEWFTVIYYKLAIDYFLGPISIYSYDSLAKIIKLALQKDIIKLDDLLLDDMQLMTLIQESNDQEIQELINSLYAKVELEENDQDYDRFTTIQKDFARSGTGCEYLYAERTVARCKG